ncbi:MAG: RnfABCDGE type electron transport complex subunit D [Clostridia bacterium]
MEKVFVSDSPHIRGKRTTKGIMLDVIIALLPATIMGCVFFGWKAVMVLCLSTLSAVVTEVVYSLCLRKNIKQIFLDFDLTSIVTGLLLGLIMSPNVKWYVPILSAVFAIAVVKMLFGGTGKNIVNPAIAGRVFAFIAFQATMISGWLAPNIDAVLPLLNVGSASITSGATPLGGMLTNGLSAMQLSNLDLFLGTGLVGCIGETCKLALLIGGVYLVIRKVIDWKYPVIYIVTTGLFAVFLNKMNWGYFLPSILSGGLFLGAIFMATDYVTSPSTTLGNVIYFLLLGAITAVLRNATHIEVVSFVILLMNIIVPLINTYIRPRIFGAPSFVEKTKLKLENAKLASKEKKEKKLAASLETKQAVVNSTSEYLQQTVAQNTAAIEKESKIVTPSAQNADKIVTTQVATNNTNANANAPTDDTAKKITAEKPAEKTATATDKKEDKQ